MDVVSEIEYSLEIRVRSRFAQDNSQYFDEKGWGR